MTIIDKIVIYKLIECDIFMLRLYLQVKSLYHVIIFSTETIMHIFRF